MTTLSDGLEKNWRHIIGDEFDYVAMKEFLQKEKDLGFKIYPKDEEIFKALNLTPLENIKVVILGQDPYHAEGQAHGLCFSTKGKKIPPSLSNIYKEIKRDCGIEMPSHGDLTGWAEQGVLLLNATLTVRQDSAGSHRGEGWEEFTDVIIRAVNEKPQPVVFLLWGASAQKKHKLIGKNHLVLEASHPSPLSARRAMRDRDREIHSFCECGHFKTANDFLEEHGLEPIDWQKIEQGT